MFTAAWFTTARTRKQPKCPSTEKQIKTTWYLQTRDYYSTIKKNGTVPPAETWTDLETVTQSEGCQQEKKKLCKSMLICGI